MSRPWEVAAHDAYWAAEKTDGIYATGGDCGDWWGFCPICSEPDLRISTTGGGVVLECHAGECDPHEIAAELRPHGKGSGHAPLEQADWPGPPTAAAFHGLAGDIVRTVEPHTEADPAALLVQTLVAFGNAVGRGPGWRVGGDFHATSLYVALVGDTSSGRKGTSWAEIRRLFERADPQWAIESVRSGLSSGEGLIHHVRDDRVDRRKAHTKAEKQEADEDGFIEEVVPGVADKRLLVIQGELGQMFKVMQREANPLSAVIRGLWDDGRAGNLTKKEPERTTDAHVSLVGHVTAVELAEGLEQVELANGFANRFLFVCTRRARSLPFGGDLSKEEIDGLAARLAEALAFAREQALLEMDGEARSAWTQVYEPLTERPAGMLGAITGRAVPLVRRLAVIYALLDLEPIVGLGHLQAALATWDYCERSAAHIFGGTIGNRTADRLLGYLREAGRDGLTRSQIRARVGGRLSGDEIDRAREELRARGLATIERVATGGRPEEHWRIAHPVEGGGKGGAVEESPQHPPSLHTDPLSSTPQTSANGRPGTAAEQKAEADRLASKLTERETP